MQKMQSNDNKIEVLDWQGHKTGEVLDRKDIHKLGKIHRAIHLYVFDKNNKLLLQRRSKNVDHYPDMFSISVTGHVDAGEDSKEAAARELKEELNIDPDLVKIEFLFSLRQDFYLNTDYIYSLQLNFRKNTCFIISRLRKE